MTIYLVLEQFLFSTKVVCGFLSREDAISFIHNQEKQNFLSYSLIVTEIYI